MSSIYLKNENVQARIADNHIQFGDYIIYVVINVFVVAIYFYNFSF